MVRALTAVLLASALAAPAAAAQPLDPARVGAIRMSYVARASKAGQSTSPRSKSSSNRRKPKPPDVRLNWISGGLRWPAVAPA